MSAFIHSFFIVFLSATGWMLNAEADFCNYEPVTCHISIANIDEGVHCKLQRIKDVNNSRKYYKLTKLGEKYTIGFPLEFIPFLNQTAESVNLHTALDQLDSRWLSHLLAFKVFVTKMEAVLLAEFSGINFKSYNDYVSVYHLHKIIIQQLNAYNAFSNPSMYPSFTDIVYNHRYSEDEVFVQERLAGTCPFMIKLITKHGRVGFKWNTLKTKLNTQFDFDYALEQAIDKKGITMNKAVELQLLYVLYHEELDGLKTIPDYFDRQPGEDGEDYNLYNMTSPITIFAQAGSGELVVVAIQLDYMTKSDVYTPKSDPFMWLFAKSVVNSADSNICQAIWHLSHIHLSGTVYCTLFRSHFSKLHPIHQIMRYHCEGTTPHVALTYETLFLPHNYGHKLFSIGINGFSNLTKVGYKTFKYGMLAYDNLLRAHGLDLKPFKYYPFRDDGKVIWSGFKRFSAKFADIYYKSDLDVKQDTELQSFADQVSIDGRGDPYGGKGNIVGFPRKFERKEEVKTFLSRFLWQIALHAAVNYPLEPYGSFIPLAPTKLYDARSKDHDTFYSTLPDRETTIGSIGFATILGNTRINRIFDYHDKIQDARLSKLVKKFYFQFHGCIQKLLEGRNANRKQEEKLGFQYFEPNWMTNSIHI